MGFLGLPEYKGLVDSWQDNKDRGNIQIGREGSAAMDVALSERSKHTRTPDGPEFADGDSRPSVFSWMFGDDRDRDDERERG